MDPVTHGLLGALAAQASSRPGKIRLAAGIGLMAALLPDADVLIRSAEDPLLTLSFHRHFTHSLIFVPVIALLASVFCWPLARGKLGGGQIYLCALAGAFTAGLLDACTSYGTHLFWPFISEPVSLAIIAIVDPIFSLILLITLVVALVWRQKFWSYLGLGLALLYLTLGLVQHQRALGVAETLAAERGQNPDRVLVKPTMANLVLWRSVTVTGDTARADAVRVGLGERVYSGETADLVRPRDWQHLPERSRVRRDLWRMYDFADRLLVLHPDEPTMVGDLRFAMLPTSTAPLWGLSLDMDRPDEAPEWETRRRLTPEMRARFLAMVLGRDITL